MATRVGRAARAAAVVFLAGAGAATWLYVRQVRPREALHQAAENEKRLFRFGRDDVVAGRLVSATATLAFERDPAAPARFRLTAPVAWPADPEALDALLDRMVTVKLDPVLTEAATAGELAAWGLEPPEIRLDVTLRSGAERSLLVGTKNPLADAFPVTDEGRARVGLSDPAFHWAFDRPVDDFRGTRLLSFEPAQIRSLTLLREGQGELTLSRKKPEGRWTLRAEGSAPRRANPRRAELLAIAFTRRLEATSFVTDALAPEQRAALGLAPPRAEVVLSTFDGESQTIVFGRRADTSAEVGAWIAHPEGTRTVAEIPEALERDLGVSVDALVDRTLSRFDPEKVQRVRMQLGAEAPFVLVRGDAGWTLEDQPAREVKGWRVDAIVRAFALLGGDATHAEAPTEAQLAEWLLAPPSRRLAFIGASGRVLADVRIGNRLDEAHLLARSARDPRVFAVAEKKLRTLPDTLSDLTDGS